MSSTPAYDPDRLLATLRQVVGDAHVLVDGAFKSLCEQDLYRAAGTPLLAVVRPASVAETSACVRACAAQVVAVVPRGGGTSYSGGYLPGHDRAVCVDTTRLNRILEVNARDGYVLVEAGVTWAQLHATLAPYGLQTRFQGTFSGLHATVGGTLSQGAVNFGSGMYGTVADEVLCLDVVTASGGLLSTGSGGNPAGLHHWRQYGPDLAGLFCGDCGSLGVKVRASLPLYRRPAFYRHCSVAFARFDDFVDTLQRVAALGIVTDNMGGDAPLFARLLKQGSQMNRLAFTAALLRDSPDPLRLLRALPGLARQAFGGAVPGSYLANFVVEGHTRREVAGKLATLEAEATRTGHKVINAIPDLIRAQPFTPLRTIVGPGGLRWRPVNGILPFSRAADMQARLDAIRRDHAEAIAREGIVLTETFMFVGSSGLLFEPALLWPDELLATHREFLPADTLARIKAHAANPAGRALVEQLRGAIVAAFRALGASHLQIGREYPYLEGRNEGARRLLADLKASLDPDHVLNPGALGLGARYGDPAA